MGNEDVVASVLVVTGPVGVGKSVVAGELARLLEEMRLPYAEIDMDWLRYCYPRPEHDRFHMALGLQNLAAISANYRAAGAKRLIVVDIVETRSSIGAYREAIPDADILVVRLNATLPTSIGGWKDARRGQAWNGTNTGRPSYSRNGKKKRWRICSLTPRGKRHRMWHRRC